MADPNLPIPTYPTGEPTSALNFGDLITEVAYKIGVAYYGSDGTGPPEVPIDGHDLAVCKRIVNKGVRKFINDGNGIGGKVRASGWRWTNPVAQIDLWPQIAYDANSPPTTYVTMAFQASGIYVGCTILTLVTPGQPPTVPSNTYVPRFLQSMEMRQIWMNGNPPSTTPGWFLPPSQQGSPLIGTAYTVLFYLSPTQLVVDGNTTTHGYPTNCPFSFACTGDYTMPANFGGQYTGGITYVANTNRGMTLTWGTELGIRARRQNYNIESGTPYEAAVRLVPTSSYAPLTNTAGLMLPRRRWELMTWRISSEFLSVLFSYTLAFNDMVNVTDVPPSPFSHDEALKACCLAIAEKEVDDQMDGPDWTYYHGIALQQSYAVDDRSAPKSLGYFGNPALYYAPASGGDVIRNFRGYWYQRPTVPVFGD